MLCLLASPSAAVNDENLWLPSRYAALFLDLRNAAKEAEALERCVTVLQGTIDLDQSSKDHPIYRVLCRQDNGKSYNEMVDGLSFKTLTTVIEIPKEPTPEELEAIRLAEEQRQMELRLKRLQALWKRCEKELRSKVALMSDIEWLTKFPPEPESELEDVINYRVDFNSMSFDGLPLQFRASCIFSAEDSLNLSIVPRR